MKQRFSRAAPADARKVKTDVSVRCIVVVALRCVARGGGSEVRDVAGSVQMNCGAAEIALCWRYLLEKGRLSSCTILHTDKALKFGLFWSPVSTSPSRRARPTAPPAESAESIEKALKAASIDAFSMVSG